MFDIPNPLEKVRPNYSVKMLNALQDVRKALEKAVLPLEDAHSWKLVVECIGLFTIAERHWVKAELRAAGWECVFKLRDSENENLLIYLA